MKGKNLALELKGYIEETWITNPETTIFQDSVTGEVIDRVQVIAAITDAKDDSSLPKSIDVLIEATHTGITKNFTEYVGSKMANSAPTWMTPYAKPVLLGHDQDGVTLGRVKSWSYGKSKLNPEKDTITLNLNITDKDSIKRHMDGTALTYSIGAQAQEVFCSICHTDILNSDEFCGHWKGRTYKVASQNEGDESTSQTCIWQIGNCEYLEISEVNVPADPWAQRLSINIPNESNNDSSSNTDIENSTDDVNLTDSFDTSVIDELLAKEVNDMDDNKPEAEVGDSTTESHEGSANVTENLNTTTSVELTDKIAELTILIDTNKCEIETLNHTIETLGRHNEELAQEIREMNQNYANTIAEMTKNQQSTFKTNVELAKLLKKGYTDSIIDAKLLLGDVDDTTESLSTKSVQELSSILTGLRERIVTKRLAPPITQANVGSEGALVAHQDSGSDTVKTGSEPKAFSAQDAVNVILHKKR